MASNYTEFNVLPFQLQRFRQRANAESVESFNLTSSPDATLSSINPHSHLTHLHNQTNISMPSLTIDIPLNSTTMIHSSRTPNYSGLRNRHKSLVGGHRYRSTSPLGDYGRHRSSPRVLAHYNVEDGAGGGEENLDELFAKLREELFK